MTLPTLLSSALCNSSPIRTIFATTQHGTVLLTLYMLGVIKKLITFGIRYMVCHVSYCGPIRWGSCISLHVLFVVLEPIRLGSDLFLHRFFSVFRADTVWLKYISTCYSLLRADTAWLKYISTSYSIINTPFSLHLLW